MYYPGRYYLCLLIVMFFGLFSTVASALTCKAQGSVSTSVNIGTVLKASIGEFGSNNKIWVSEPITATFTCTDTDSFPQGENAYLWLDPKDVIKNVHQSLEVGITVRNVDYILKKGSKVEIGPGTVCNKNAKGECTKPALPQTFTLTYQVYIKTTGQQAADNGKVMGSASLSLFQVDGVGGLRGSSGGTDGNFNLYITGLDNITFLACKPKVTLSPEKLHFGTMSSRQAVPGRIQKTMPFSVLVDLSEKGSGKTCTGETLMLTISSTNFVKDGSIIMPTKDGGFGFIISENDSLQPRIAMNTPQKLDMISGDLVRHDYFAGFIWTTRSPALGNYSAMATMTVTFK